MTESNATTERELITPGTPEAFDEPPVIYTLDSSPSAAAFSSPPAPAALSRSSSISSDMNKTAMSFDEKENTTSSSGLEISEDVLRMDAKGFTGFVERVPLWVKLLVMTFVCAVGLVMVGSWLVTDKGITVNKSSKSLQYISFSSIVQSTAQKCQAERRISRRYFNGVAKQEDLIQFYATSTLQSEIQALLALIKQINYQDTRIQELENKLSTFEKQLRMVRQDVLDKRTTSVATFYTYTDLTTDLIDLVTSLITAFETSQHILQHLFFLKLRDTQGQVYAFMQLYSNTTSNTQFQNQLSRLLGERDTSMRLLKQLTTRTMLAALNSNIYSQNYATFAAVEKNISNLENNTLIKLPSSFTTVAEGLLAQYDSLVAAASEEIRITTTSAMNEAVIGIVVVVVFSIIVLIGSLLVNFCVSSSVIGPWRRLNMLQELTMAKFVPRQFLHLLKCNRITDVSLGKNAVRDNLFIVQFSIHEFHKIVKQKNMTHDQTIQFINSFLMYFGEVARTFGGYIDRYYPDGFICLFTKSKNAIKCTTEMHRCIELYNTKVHTLTKPIINASVSLVKATQTLVGAVGENDRIQPVLVSEDVAVAHKLINLAFKYKAGMIIAKSVKTEFSKSHKFRLLGRLHLSDGNYTNIYELVDGNCPAHKLKTCKDFSAGVKSMLKQDYANALAKLDLVVKESKESDDLAKYLKAVCHRQVERNRAASNQLIVTDTLRDPTLREGFQQYCQQERSIENIHMWTLLEDFKAFANFTSRHLIAQKVLSQYLSNTGDNHVNLSAEVRNKYKLKVEKIFTGIRSPRTQEELMKDHFFRGLQSELELVMNDTHARFKNTELFQKTFAKSKYSSQPSCITSALSETLILQ